LISNTLIIISVGQLFLHPVLNEYIIVTKSNKGQISYKGVGISGLKEDESFLESFGPVDPEDVSDEEIQVLLSFCPSGTKAKVGFIVQE
jgi:hypothetical protein